MDNAIRQTKVCLIDRKPSIFISAGHQIPVNCPLIRVNIHQSYISHIHFLPKVFPSFSPTHPISVDNLLISSLLRNTKAGLPFQQPCSCCIRQLLRLRLAVFLHLILDKDFGYLSCNGGHQNKRQNVYPLFPT